jgi:hypothetical protein
MTAMNFRRKCLPKMQLYPMSKLATSNVNISLHLLSPVPQDTSRSMHPMGLPWDDHVERIMYRGQVFQIKGHLNEGFPHDKI